MALSIITTTYQGQSSFPLNFPLGILSRDHIKVRINNALDGSNNPVYSSNYEWINDNEISISGLSNGDAVEITRTVPKESLIASFEDGTNVTGKALDLQSKQVLMAFHELIDGRSDGLSDVISAAYATSAELVDAITDRIGPLSDVSVLRNMEDTGPRTVTLFDGYVWTTDGTLNHGGTDDGGVSVIDQSGRLWKRVFTGSIDLGWYGWENASASERGVLFVQIFNRAPLGASIYVPAGFWDVDLGSSRASLRDGQTLYGAGMEATTLSFTGNIVGGCIRWAGEDQSIQDMTLDMSSVPGTFKTLVSMGGLKNGSMKRVKLYAGTDAPVARPQEPIPPSYTDWATQGHFCIVAEPATSLTDRSKDVDGVVFEDCIMYKSWRGYFSVNAKYADPNNPGQFINEVDYAIRRNMTFNRCGFDRIANSAVVVNQPRVDAGTSGVVNYLDCWATSLERENPEGVITGAAGCEFVTIRGLTLMGRHKIPVNLEECYRWDVSNINGEIYMIPNIDCGVVKLNGNIVGSADNSVVPSRGTIVSDMNVVYLGTSDSAKHRGVFTVNNGNSNTENMIIQNCRFVGFGRSFDTSDDTRTLAINNCRSESATGAGYYLRQPSILIANNYSINDTVGVRSVTGGSIGKHTFIMSGIPTSSGQMFSVANGALFCTEYALEFITDLSNGETDVPVMHLHDWDGLNQYGFYGNVAVRATSSSFANAVSGTFLVNAQARFGGQSFSEGTESSFLYETMGVSGAGTFLIRSENDGMNVDANNDVYVRFVNSGSTANDTTITINVTGSLLWRDG